MSHPELERTDGSLTFTWQDVGIQATIDRIVESKDELSCELTIAQLVAGSTRLLQFGRFNLLAQQTRNSWAKALSAQCNTVDWQPMLLEMTYLATDAFRKGSPARDLRVGDPFGKQRWLIYPYIEYGGPTVLYAEGGHGKSVLALWIGLQVALGARDQKGQKQKSQSVLYLDYETEFETHQERLLALGEGMGVCREALPPLYYRRMDTSLPSAVESLRDEIHDLSIGMVVVDSLGMAGTGALEDASTAIGLAQAIRRLSVPVLGIHHKRKGSGQKEENARDRLFGSVYFMNFPRLVWEVESVSEAASETSVIVNSALTNVKANNGRLHNRHALRLTFTNDAEGYARNITVKPTEIMDVEEFAERAPLKERIKHALSRGPMSSTELAQELSLDLSNVQSRLSRFKKDGFVTQLPDKSFALQTHEEPPF